MSLVYGERLASCLVGRQGEGWCELSVGCGQKHKAKFHWKIKLEWILCFCLINTLNAQRSFPLSLKFSFKFELLVAVRN